MVVHVVRVSYGECGVTGQPFSVTVTVTGSRIRRPDRDSMGLPRTRWVQSPVSDHSESESRPVPGTPSPNTPGEERDLVSGVRGSTRPGEGKTGDGDRDLLILSPPPPSISTLVSYTLDGSSGESNPLGAVHRE